MKGFEQQIANAAQALRDEQNVGLTPPQLPRKNSASKAPVFAWWTRVAVAYPQDLIQDKIGNVKNANFHTILIASWRIV